MELIKKNFFDTATQIAVNSNTSTAKEIMNPDPLFQYASEGFNDDATTTTITISFNETLAVSRIGLVDMNFKKFNMYYNGATANTFSFTSTSATTTSQFTTNSETAMYFVPTSQACTSVTFDIYSTIVAAQEKAIGYVVLSDKHIDFDVDHGRIPAAKNYKPKIAPKEIVHKLSDGGVRIHTIEQKWKAQVKFKHITESFRDDLRDVYDLHDDFIFVGFGTATSWDKVIFPCVWPGTFEFYRYSDDNIGAGFTGMIKIDQT